MKKNDLVKVDKTTFRILALKDEGVLAIDCEKKEMPKVYPISFFEGCEVGKLHYDFPTMENLTPEQRRIAFERYSLVAGAVTVIDKVKERTLNLNRAAGEHKISKQTLRAYLCSYLIYQDVAALAPKETKKRELTQDEKNMRWGLNQFFYTKHQNSLSTAYIMTLKAKYCDSFGKLKDKHPTFNQFRYFYRKTRKLENYYISRDGIKSYQRSKRPLMGDGVQQFAPNIGTAMLDGTICDIHLVNEAGQLVGRPILLFSCDTNTSMCLGYALLWEGGVYSLQNLMLNIIEDKVELCKRLGISIEPEQWSVSELPGVMVTDAGKEFRGLTFEQITELGVSLVTLPPYRPDLKGPIEKLFDLVQNSYKDVLKGKGVIMPDFQERGSRDYRKDAKLTLEEFERIVVKCIIYHNCHRVLQNYPYTPEMLEEKVSPYPNAIWNFKKKEVGANLIVVQKRELVLTLLPRTKAKFTRFGLEVQKLRYYANGYKEQFLSGGEAVVAYNPDNCGKVWLTEKDGRFVEFSLINARFAELPFTEVQKIQKEQKKLMNPEKDDYQARIELMSFIEGVVSKPRLVRDVQVKEMGTARRKARQEKRVDMGGVIGE